MKFPIVFIFALLLSSCHTLHRNDSSSQFFGVYKSLPFNEKSISLHLQDQGQGFFTVDENKKVPVLWRESLGKLILSYSSFTVRFLPVKVVNSEGETKAGLQYFDRPNIPRGPFTPLNLIKVE